MSHMRFKCGWPGRSLQTHGPAFLLQSFLVLCVVGVRCSHAADPGQPAPAAFHLLEPTRLMPPLSQSLWSVKVIIHVHVINHYAEVLKQQLLHLHFSGLYQRCEVLHVYLSGPDRGELDQAALLPPYYGDKFVVHTALTQTGSGERDTLEAMWQLLSPKDKVLFMHTNSVKHGIHHQPATQWRMFLEYFNIRNWRLCLCLLDLHDTVGAGYSWEQNAYAGNFWWTTGQYYLSLPRDTFHSSAAPIGHDASTEALLRTGFARVFNLADQLGSGLEAKMAPHMWDKLWTRNTTWHGKADRCFHLAV